MRKGGKEGGREKGRKGERMEGEKEGGREGQRERGRESERKKRDRRRVQSLDPSELYVRSDSCRIYHGPCEFCFCFSKHIYVEARAQSK